MADITPDEQGLFIMPELDDTTELGAVADAAKTVTIPEYIMPDKVYDVLKWVALLLCPALASLVSHVGNAWEYAYADRVAITIVEVGLFIGGCIGISQISSTSKPKRSGDE